MRKLGQNIRLITAVGNYISFMGRDDEYEPEYFEKRKSYLDDKSDIVVMSIKCH